MSLFTLFLDKSHTNIFIKSLMVILTLLISPDSRSRYINDAVISIGSKFFVFNARNRTCLIYDIEKNTWSENHFEVNVLKLF